MEKPEMEDSVDAEEVRKQMRSAVERIRAKFSEQVQTTAEPAPDPDRAKSD